MADDTTATPTESTIETDAPAQATEPKPAAKAASKTASKKKTTKKPAAKKRVRKKTATKKAESDAAPESPTDDQPDNQPDEQASEQAEAEPTAEAAPKKKPTRRKKTTARKADASTDDSSDEPTDEDASDTTVTIVDETESAEERAIEPDDDAPDRAPAVEAPSEMIINYTPGEECRIAIIEDGKLEEFDAEPTENVSRVGNIYRGKVVNIERNIQAAFVDFGTEEAGFLHLSDLHPRYFPGADDDETEKVGRKTPRRHRPPIEKALRKGQEITVQVLKEGVGTKGPTLTSYLSIPGRFLVMMPDMDKVGVSRKVEDDDLRKKMRKILDQLELPGGFGFILRTAGLERTKTDLKRDLAYLQRLWKDMERKQKKAKGPTLLYSEADLLLRTLRDRVTNQVQRIVIDNKAALARAAGFMKIVAPRATTKLCHFDEKRPIFHAFGIEPQLELMHATEVPLPSGGALVMEQTEALVAIDVNSGRSRGARDAESNAYQTNVEAVDEICRQLRLRDLGGLVICDLIDMRHASNRKDIENRFKDRLKRDRARSTTLPISAFGILEMTRQRMRGSYEQAHFHTCPRCTGRGLIQRPDSIAASALRNLTALLEHDRVQRVELVVSSVVAGALLSTRRGTLGRIERVSGKRIDVHVKETLAAGRVVMYAYDNNGADIDIERLPRKGSKPRVLEWAKTDLAKQLQAEGDDWAVDLEQEAADLQSELDEEILAHEEEEAKKIAELDLPPEAGSDDDEESGGKKKRKRRRRRRGRRSDEENRSDEDGSNEGDDATRSASDNKSSDDKPSDAGDDSDDDEQSSGERANGKKKSRRRRRRRSGDDDESTTDQGDASEGSSSDDTTDTSGDASSDAEGSDDSAEDGSGKKKRRRRRRRGRGRSGDESGSGESGSSESSDQKPEAKPKAKTEAKTQPKADSGSSEDSAKPEGDAKPKRKRRALYGSGRRALSASEKGNIDRD